MADEPRASGSGTSQSGGSSAGSLTWLWMVLAVITVAGFLTWLGLKSEPTQVTVVEDDEESAVMVPGAEVIPKDTLAADKSAWEAQLIQVANVAATGSLGERVFWGELGDPANQVPILIRLDSAAAAELQPQMGAAYTVAGLVFPMSDSMAGAWLEEGLLAGEGERMQAGFADYYIQVSAIRPTRTQQGAAGDTAASDTAGADTATAPDAASG